MKNKNIYTCQKCSAQFPKWMGQCNECGAWDSIVEETVTTTTNNQNPRFTNHIANSEITAVTKVNLIKQPRMLTNITELDRALGGGLVTGSIVLIGGDPGIGKSTLLLQTLNNLSANYSTLYVTGEESLQQVALRAQRLKLTNELPLLAETNVETIINQAKQAHPQIIVIDSIQTVYTELLQSSPGSVGQVRESAAQLVRYAKQTDTALFLVGHVTKEGTLAGPRVLEHMVDSVLYFEGERDGRFRVIRAIKNRFGAVNELGVFAMTDTGLREVNNPSAIFLSRNSSDPIPGSVVMATWEGSRPLLVEVQALVDSSHLGNPRRITVGLEHNRLSMLLAVLHRHGGIPTYDQDVFVNVVGGVKVPETAADLALLLAIISSLRNRPLPNDLLVFGEVGLSGEIRPVQNGQQRLKEASKHGFKQAIIPFANAPKTPIPNIKITATKNIAAALQALD